MLAGHGKVPTSTVVTHMKSPQSAIVPASARCQTLVSSSCAWTFPAEKGSIRQKSYP